MIDTKPAYQRQLETNVCVTLSMTHLSNADVKLLEGESMGHEQVRSLEVIINDDCRLMVKMGELLKYNELSKLSQPGRQLFMNMHASGVRFLLFDVDGPVLEGVAVGDNRLESARKIYRYTPDCKTLNERIEECEMVMVIPSSAVYENNQVLRDIGRSYPEYDPLTALEIMDLHWFAGSAVYFA